MSDLLYLSEQLLRIKRNSQNHIDFIIATDKMFNGLAHRGYRKKKLYKLRDYIWTCSNDLPKNRFSPHLQNQIIRPLSLKFNPINLKLLNLTANIIKKYEISQHISFIKITPIILIYVIY